MIKHFPPQNHKLMARNARITAGDLLNIGGKWTTANAAHFGKSASGYDAVARPMVDKNSTPAPTTAASKLAVPGKWTVREIGRKPISKRDTWAALCADLLDAIPTNLGEYIAYAFASADACASAKRRLFRLNKKEVAAAGYSISISAEVEDGKHWLYILPSANKKKGDK